MSSLPNFIETVPDYEVRDGRMHISMGGMALVMPINVFLVGCECGCHAIEQWNATHVEAEIIEVDFASKFQRVYPKGKRG